VKPVVPPPTFPPEPRLPFTPTISPTDARRSDFHLVPPRCAIQGRGYNLSRLWIPSVLGVPLRLTSPSALFTKGLSTGGFEVGRCEMF